MRPPRRPEEPVDPFAPTLPSDALAPGRDGQASSRRADEPLASGFPLRVYHLAKASDQATADRLLGDLAACLSRARPFAVVTEFRHPSHAGDTDFALFRWMSRNHDALRPYLVAYAPVYPARLRRLFMRLIGRVPTFEFPVRIFGRTDDARRWCEQQLGSM